MKNKKIVFIIAAFVVLLIGAVCFFLFGKDKNTIIKALENKGEKEEQIEYDFEEIRKMRASWGLFRDRRPECYKTITE